MRRAAIYQLLFLVFLVLLMFITVCSASGKTTELAVFGDSLSKGTFSGTFAKPQTNNELFGTFQFLIKPTHRTWSYIHPIAKRESFRSLFNGDLVIKNFAVNGAKSYDLFDQIIEWKPKHKSRMAIIIVGPNDVCTEKQITPGKDFERAIKDAMVLLKVKVRSYEKIHFFLGPDVTRLIKVMGQLSVPVQQTCETLFTKVHKFCRRVTVDNEIEPVKNAYTHYNSFLNNYARKKGFKYYDNIYRMDFGINDLAFDCFHANLNGQEKIAKEVFTAVNKNTD